METAVSADSNQLTQEANIKGSTNSTATLGHTFLCWSVKGGRALLILLKNMSLPTLKATFKNIQLRLEFFLPSLMILS